MFYYCIAFGCHACSVEAMSKWLPKPSIASHLSLCLHLTLLFTSSSSGSLPSSEPKVQQLSKCYEFHRIVTSIHSFIWFVPQFWNVLIINLIFILSTLVLNKLLNYMKRKDIKLFFREYEGIPLNIFLLKLVTQANSLSYNVYKRYYRYIIYPLIICCLTEPTVQLLMCWSLNWTFELLLSSSLLSFNCESYKVLDNIFNPLYVSLLNEWQVL